MFWTSIRHLLNLYTIFSEPIYCFSQATRVSFNNLSLLLFGAYKHAGEIITTNRYSCLRTYKVFFPDKSQRQVETQGESHAELQNTWETLPPPSSPPAPKKCLTYHMRLPGNVTISCRKDSQFGLLKQCIKIREQEQKDVLMPLYGFL